MPVHAPVGCTPYLLRICTGSHLYSERRHAIHMSLESSQSRRSSLVNGATERKEKATRSLMLLLPTDRQTDSAYILFSCLGVWDPPAKSAPHPHFLPSPASSLFPITWLAHCPHPHTDLECPIAITLVGIWPSVSVAKVIASMQGTWSQPGTNKTTLRVPSSR